jgi:anti-anti-sigma regulatory factor
MVFSFFKKPPEKMVARPAAAPRPQAAPAPAPAGESSSAAIDPKPAVAAPAPVAEVANNSLDFSDFQFSESPANFHVEMDVDPIESDVEQAAVLYANGQDEAARAMLEDAVRVHHFGPGERLWLMLFDLYRLTGQKAAFESLEVDYTQSFEKSPPAWRDSSKTPVAAKLAVAGAVFFKGELTGDNQAGFDMVRQALEKNPKLRLDLSKIKSLDAPGCGYLLALLQQAHKAKREIELLGRDNIGTLLEGRVEAGLAEDSECWLLLLELYQLQGQQEAFDDVAINYAVTFEVSPPSWEAKRVAAAEPVPVAIALAVVDDDLGAEAYPVRGDIKASRFSDLLAFAEVHDPVILDFSMAIRVDFISAGALLNVLSTVRRSGKQIVFRHPNHLVAELFGVVGLKAVAEIIFAKH